MNIPVTDILLSMTVFSDASKHKQHFSYGAG